MDANPSPDGHGTAEHRPSAGPGAAAGPEVERFGPLALRRLTKDDGRSLIVFERVDRGPQGGSGDTGAGGARA